jgi:hypothetical protein
MPFIHYVKYLYLSTLAFSAICGLRRFKTQTRAIKFISILITLTFIFEFIAIFVIRFYKNNMPIYSIFNLIQFFVVAYYFDESIDVFKKRKIGMYVGYVGLFLGLLNIIIFQPLTSFNSNFLILEGLSIISMALFSFFRLLVQYEEFRFTSFSHFWISVILLFFWSITFLNWGLYDYIGEEFNDKIWIINLSILIVNIITYLSFGLVFIFYKKLRHDIE